jgi:hypothetical protein
MMTTVSYMREHPPSPHPPAKPPHASPCMFREVYLNRTSLAPCMFGYVGDGLYLNLLESLLHAIPNLPAAAAGTP